MIQKLIGTSHPDERGRAMSEEDWGRAARKERQRSQAPGLAEVQSATRDLVPDVGDTPRVRRQRAGRGRGAGAGYRVPRCRVRGRPTGASVYCTSVCGAYEPLHMSQCIRLMRLNHFSTPRLPHRYCDPRV